MYELCYISNFELFLIKLWSLSEPPTVVVTLPNYAVDFGRQVALGCTVTANPAHTSVNWKKIKNGVSTDIEMANSGKYSGSSVSSPSLVINNANLDDEASYVCYATNSIGTGQSTSTVLDVVGSKYKQYGKKGFNFYCIKKKIKQSFYFILLNTLKYWIAKQEIFSVYFSSLIKLLNVIKESALVVSCKYALFVCLGLMSLGPLVAGK